MMYLSVPNRESSKTSIKGKAAILDLQNKNVVCKIYVSQVSRFVQMGWAMFMFYMHHVFNPMLGR